MVLSLLVAYEMKVQIDCLITRAVVGNKRSDLIYVDAHDVDTRGRVSFSVGTDVTSPDRLLSEKGVVRIVGEVTPIRFDKNQILRFDKLTITPVPSK